MPDKKGTFKFVCIPADVSESLQELTQDYTDQDEVECLLSRVKVRYRSVQLISHGRVVVL